MVLRQLLFSGMVCGTALLSACGAGYQWSQARSLNSIAAYHKFLSKYPNDPHAVDAEDLIAKLREERAWTTAQIASSIQGENRTGRHACPSGA